MNDFNVQGKDHKVAATQETITAQNSTNQGYFNGISQEQLNTVCEAIADYAGPLFNPSYFVNYLQMADKFIHSARMGEDKRNMVLNSIGLLCSTMLDQKNKENKYGPWEHTAEEFYPNDLETALDDPDEDADYILEQGLNEICYIIADFTNDDGEYTEGSWDEAKDVIDEYIRILSEQDYDIPEYIYNDMKEIESKWA